MPFQGNKVTLINFRRSLAERKRRAVGPYYMMVPPVRNRGMVGGYGYYATDDFGNMDSHDSMYRLRASLANDHLSDNGYGSLSRINGYYCDEDGLTTLHPVVFRLPRSRGFLAGYTMGKGMASTIATTIYDSIEDAARGAHAFAESEAETEREYQEEQERERIQEETGMDEDTYAHFLEYCGRYLHKDRKDQDVRQEMERIFLAADEDERATILDEGWPRLQRIAEDSIR